MKKINFSIVLILLATFTINAKIVRISNSGATFTPDSVSIALGDTVQFAISTNHNAVEVSKATYDANGKTSNGGFSLPFGGGSIVLTKADTYYYVCQPHASMGMKGIIVVTDATTSVKSVETNNKFLLYPNPSANFVNVSMYVQSSCPSSACIYNITGALVKKYNFDLLQGTNNLTLQYNGDLKAGKYILEIIADNKKYTNLLLVK